MLYCWRSAILFRVARSILLHEHSLQARVAALGVEVEKVDAARQMGRVRVEEGHAVHTRGQNPVHDAADPPAAGIVERRSTIPSCRGGTARDDRRVERIGSRRSRGPRADGGPSLASGRRRTDEISGCEAGPRRRRIRRPNGVAVLTSGAAFKSRRAVRRVGHRSRSKVGTRRLLLPVEL